MSGFTAVPADADPSAPVLLRELHGSFYGRFAIASFVQSTGEPPRPLLLAASVPGLHYIEVWDTRTGIMVANLKGPEIILPHAHAVYELPDHRPRIYGGDKDGRFIIFDGDSLTEAHQGNIGPGGVRSCYVYKTLEGDRPRIVSGHADGSVTVLDGETGELIRRFEPPTAGAGAPVFALAGLDHPLVAEHRTVAASGGLVWVFCPEAGGEIIMTLEVSRPPIMTLACFEPTHGPGRFCVAARTAQAAWVWEEGALTHTFVTHSDKEKITDMKVGSDCEARMDALIRSCVYPPVACW
jgi:WD40 repeat protein